MQVEAAVNYEKSAPFQIKKLTMKDIGPSDVLVKIVGAGLCHTDLAARDEELPVKKPCVLGHEGSGIVQAVGASVTKVVPGDHVVLTYAFCGECPTCTSGHPAYCDNLLPLTFTDGREGEAGSFYDGEKAIHGHFFGQSSFANYAIAHHTNVIKVRKDAPLELLGVLGCGVQTGAVTVMNVLKARPGDSIVVFGVGPVGMSAVLAAKVCACNKIIAVDVLESRLDKARELGATDVINVNSAGSIADKIRTIVPHGVKHALDTTGRVENCKAGLDVLGTLGKLAFVGVPHGNKPLEVDLFPMMIQGKSIMGVVQGDSLPHVFIPMMIDLYMAGQFPFDKMIAKYKLRQINEAIEDQSKGTVVKVVFTLD